MVSTRLDRGFVFLTIITLYFLGFGFIIEKAVPLSCQIIIYERVI